MPEDIKPPIDSTRHFRRSYGEARYAACTEHAADALLAFDGGVVEIRRIVTPDSSLLCHCHRQADFHLLEVNTF